MLILIYSMFFKLCSSTCNEVILFSYKGGRVILGLITAELLKTNFEVN